MEQKDSKGNPCWRPSQKNGYCNIHQKHAKMELAKQENKKKCKTHRCIEFLKESSDRKYCETCLDKKKIPSEVCCKAFIESGTRKGEQCIKKATSDGFCGKHVIRNILLQQAKENDKRICDDGKRACKNFTENNQLHCNNCLAKNRELDILRQREKQKNPNRCLDCGIEVLEQQVGLKDNLVQRCNSCYQKLRNIEDKRRREDRNQKAERKKNVEKHWKEQKRGAYVRNLWFEITLTQFENLVNSNCFYCNHRNENEVLGIDRINSDLGYSMDNCVASCETCNYMKRNMNVLDFLTHISKIFNNKISVESKLKVFNLPLEIVENNKLSHKSYIRPNKITELYMKQQLQPYIDICKEEKRHPKLIEGLEAMRNQKIKRNEFNTYITKLLYSTAND